MLLSLRQWHLKQNSPTEQAPSASARCYSFQSPYLFGFMPLFVREYLRASDTLSLFDPHVHDGACYLINKMAAQIIKLAESFKSTKNVFYLMDAQICAAH